MPDLLKQLKALADPSRIRIIRALSREPLHVSELLEVLDMGQSRVSRHLRILSDAAVLLWRRDGSRIYYGIHPELRTHSLWSVLGDEAAAWNSSLQRILEEDRQRLQGILESRKERSLVHFEDFGARQDEDQREYVDATYYRSKIIELLPGNAGQVLEPGCGAGALASMLADRASHLILVDQSRTMLDVARERIAAVGSDVKTEYRVGYMEHLPLADEEVDTVILSMALHHSAEPGSVLKEAFRVLRPGGLLVVAELKQHGEENMRRLFEDFWLGFDEGVLLGEIERAGFEGHDVSEGRGNGRLDCLFVSARKPARGRSRMLRVRAGESSAV
jgi:ArsR family transcriptional regulator